MISLSEEKVLYSEIQKKLFYIIPEKWESIYLYASIIDMPNKRPIGEMYFYYFPKGIIRTKPINCYEIPNAFNIDEIEYSKLITELYDLIKKLRIVFMKKAKKKWSNLTISIKDFQFKIEYDYQDLKKSIFTSYERHVIWRYIYLNTDLNLFGKKDRKIIDRYINYINTVNLPKKEMYIEGIYKQPVKNIVDFEKTLSVEEIIAQSNEPELKEKKKRISLLKKKKVINDIIEMDEEEEIINNQILNWKKE